ncbi:helix-turn-helix domain-containing protein [Nocardia sp. NPDC127579]|uniref:helix-turn-helix domain-containing protein n=1 Tax=Nocardia sp. NPDC127579 TaxID=3345402 RepID=UPI0036437326
MQPGSERSASGPDVRLSALAFDAEAVSRVVAYFDGFVESGANADAVVRAAALLAECPVGVRWPSGVIRYDGAGRPIDGDCDTAADVWLERPANPHPLDGVLVDRLRHCVRMAEARRAADLGLGDPALLEVVLSEQAGRADRGRALRLLGVDPAREIRMLAVTGPGAGEAVRILTQRVRFARSAALGPVTAVLIQDSGAGADLSDALNSAVVQAFPVANNDIAGPWTGIGERLPALAAATSWEQAVRALRFASSTWQGRRVIAFERLGSLDLLADLPVQRLLGTADVMRINDLAATETGALAVDTLEAFCVYGSLRRTAAELHLHHSTVAARIAHVEAAMGWDMGAAIDRFTATLVLTVRRIALSATALSDARRTDGPVSATPGG